MESLSVGVTRHRNATHMWDRPTPVQTLDRTYKTTLVESRPKVSRGARRCDRGNSRIPPGIIRHVIPPPSLLPSAASTTHRLCGSDKPCTFTMSNDSLKRAALSSMCLSAALPERMQPTTNSNTCAAAVFVVSNVCDQFRGRYLSSI